MADILTDYLPDGLEFYYHCLKCSARLSRIDDCLTPSQIRVAGYQICQGLRLFKFGYIEPRCLQVVCMDYYRAQIIAILRNAENSMGIKRWLFCQPCGTLIGFELVPNQLMALFQERIY